MSSADVRNKQHLTSLQVDLVRRVLACHFSYREASCVIALTCRALRHHSESIGRDEYQERVLITDAMNGHIVEFDGEGTVRRRIKSHAKRKRGKSPYGARRRNNHWDTGLTFGWGGKLYQSQYPDKIAVFNAMTLEYERLLIQDKRLENPEGLAFTGNRLWVVCAGDERQRGDSEGRVHCLIQDGEKARLSGETYSTGRGSFPWGICAVGQGHKPVIYVAAVKDDHENNGVVSTFETAQYNWVGNDIEDFTCFRKVGTTFEARRTVLCRPGGIKILPPCCYSEGEGVMEGVWLAITTKSGYPYCAESKRRLGPICLHHHRTHVDDRLYVPPHTEGLNMELPEPEDLAFTRRGDLLVLCSPDRSMEDGTPIPRPAGAQPIVSRYPIRDRPVNLPSDWSLAERARCADRAQNQFDYNNSHWTFFGVKDQSGSGRLVSDPNYREPRWEAVAEANGILVDN